MDYKKELTRIILENYPNERATTFLFWECLFNNLLKDQPGYNKDVREQLIQITIAAVINSKPGLTTINSITSPSSMNIQEWLDFLQSLRESTTVDVEEVSISYNEDDDSLEIDFRSIEKKSFVLPDLSRIVRILDKASALSHAKTQLDKLPVNLVQCLASMDHNQLRQLLKKYTK